MHKFDGFITIKMQLYFDEKQLVKDLGEKYPAIYLAEVNIFSTFATLQTNEVRFRSSAGRAIHF